MSAAWRLIMRIPASLKVTVPLILLGFVAILSTVNLLYHVPQAERAAEEDNRKRLAQEMSRLQSTLEYLLLKGDAEAAQHEIAVLAHNHDVVLAALTDEQSRSRSPRRDAPGLAGRSPTCCRNSISVRLQGRSASAAPT